MSSEITSLSEAIERLKAEGIFLRSDVLNLKGVDVTISGVRGTEANP